jgi:YidC/Oxa1 family membrane protein insertase
MDKNSVIGLIIIALILVIYGIVNKPSQEEIQRAKRRQDSLKKVQQQEQTDTARQQQQSQQQTQQKQAAAQENEQQQQQQTDIDTTRGDLSKKYGSFGRSAKGEQKFVVLENNRIKARLSTRGGKPYMVELKKYETYEGEPLVLFDGKDNIFGFNFFADNRRIATNDLYFQPTNSRDSIYVDNNPQTVNMRLYAGENNYIEYQYTLKPNSNILDFNVRFVGMNKIIPNNYRSLNLQWEINTPQQERGADNENNFTTIGYKFYQDDVDDIRARANDEASEEINTRLKWMAFKQQFFSSILVANEYFSNGEVSFNTLDDSQEYLKRMRAELAMPYETQPRYQVPMHFYFGPNHYRTLQAYDQDFEDLVNLGPAIFSWVSKYIIIPIFNWLNNSIANYGIIILLLTLMIKLVLFPLTYRSYLSQAKMRVLKPEIDEINKKYPKKEDNMKKQRATMDLYKKAGVNPLGGCIPMLLQLPILIAMVRFFPSSFELRQESFLWATDLSSYDSILSLPFEIPLYGDHVSLFTLLMAVTLVFTTRINSAQMGSTGQQMPGMKFFTTYFMPVMLLVIFNGFSSALSYYFLLSNAITLGQTLLIRNFVDDEAIHRKLKENKKKPAKKSKWQQRLEEAQKKRGYQPKKR